MIGGRMFDELDQYKFNIKIINNCSYMIDSN